MVGTLLLWLGCSGGDDGPPPIGPEICDNDIDDNGNGLVDCEDSQFCGGLACAPTGDDDDDDTVPLADIEVDYDGSTLEFSFTPAANCSQVVRQFTVINRNEDVDAVVDANCDLALGGVTAFGWDVEGANPRQYVVDEPLPASSSMDLHLLFGCRNIDEVFTTKCRIKADLTGLVDQVEFDVTGSPQ